MQTENSICEACGEQPAYYFGGEAVLCANCLGCAVSQTLETVGLGHVCGQLMRHENGIHSICLEPYGTEHDHDF